MRKRYFNDKIYATRQKRFKRKTVTWTSERISGNVIFFMTCYMASTPQCADRIMLKSQSNIASKPAPGMQGYTKTKINL